MEMPFASLSVDGRQLAAGRKVEAEHDKAIKYLLLTANPELPDAEVTKLMVLARDLIAKTHLAEFGNYYLPFLKDAEAAMKAAEKPGKKDGAKEESLTQEVNSLKALLVEASERWIHWWLLGDGKVIKVEDGTHYRYVAKLSEKEAVAKFKISPADHAELKKASDDDRAPSSEVLKSLLNHNIRLSLYAERKEFGIESDTIDDSTLERIQTHLPQEAKDGAKEVVWDAPFDSALAPIQTTMATFVSAGSMHDLGGIRRVGGSSLAQFREDEGPGPFESERLFNSIQHGSRVTILTRQGQKITGRATIRNDRDGIWVLNMGGKHGTPGIASPENVVAVKGGLKEDVQFSPNKWSKK